MKHLIGLVLVLLTSCTVNRDLNTVRYNHRDDLKYSIDVPKDYEVKGYEVTTEIERRYVYDDSSYIYITNFTHTPNYENIELLGDSILQYRFQNEELVTEVNEILGKEELTVLPRRFELSGKNRKSLFWKDIKIGEVSIGYVNVPREKKELYDKSLKTFRITR